jgi:hypothetical protein
MRTRLLTAVLFVNAVLAGCASVDMSRYIHAADVNVPSRSTEISVQENKPTVQKSKFDSLPAAYGIGPNCFTTPNNNFGGLLVYGGKDSQDRYYSCKAGAPLRMAPLFTNLNTQLIQHLCDISKPVIQSKTNGDLLVTCTYRGPEFVPSSVDGVRILVLK